MAEPYDEAGEKQHEPSERRRLEARRQGRVFKSTELVYLASLLAVIVFFALLLPPLAEKWMAFGRAFLLGAGEVSLNAQDARYFQSRLLFSLLSAIALPAALFVVAALIGNLVQHGPLLTVGLLKPDWARISPLAGLKRLFSGENLMNALKIVGKVCLVAVVIFLVLWPQRSGLRQMVFVSPSALASWLHARLLVLLLASALVFGLVALGDLLYQRERWRKRLRMTHREWRDDLKESEGNPEVKRRFHHLRQRRSQQQMMAAIPLASVVITNPVHVAVAIRFDATMSAPRVVAKGADHMALKIADAARSHGVPLVENRPLARALFAGVKVGDEIPAAFYAVIAKILAFLWQDRLPVDLEALEGEAR